MLAHPRCVIDAEGYCSVHGWDCAEFWRTEHERSKAVQDKTQGKGREGGGRG